MNIEGLVDSNEYKCKLSEHLTALLRRTKSSQNEATTAFAFESEIYYLIKSFFSIEIQFKKEENQNTLRHKFIGRIDAISNNLVIEYKKRGKLDKEVDKNKASIQLQKYLTQLKEENGNEYYGILTDGIKIRYIYFQSGELHNTSFKNIDEQDLDRLIKSLLDINNKKFVPRNIVEDFKLTSKNEITSRLANYLFEALKGKKSDKTSMLYQEWEVLFHLSENDKGQNEDISKRRKALSKIFNVDIQDTNTDYQALFALQTTYAIIVKLIACKVVTKIEFNADIEYFSDLTSIDSEMLRKFLEYIEDGYVFQTGGIRNLLEGDFFSWYCLNEIWSKEESKILLDLINILEGYSINYYKHGYTTIDIFIDLYMEIMPSEVRHSLGEYFTPSWLADFVVQKSKRLLSKNNFKAIDPCCGSGVFVMSLIRDIIGKNDILSLNDSQKKQLLLSILNRVKGIDINPLSVLTAKVCYYLSIRPLVNGNDIEIPIYLGDSANIPTKIKLGYTYCYSYTINTIQENIEVILPVSFVEHKEFFRLMSQIQAIIKVGDSSLVYEKFISNINSSELSDLVKEHIHKLAEQLVVLHKKNWDGIWIRIVANFMLVARVNNIDLIIGNPPWVKWEFLPQSYAEKIKGLCLDRHLFSGQTYMGAISLNICALIANVTSSSWLNDDGILAFLMPQTLMTQDSYAGFRNFYLDSEKKTRMYLHLLDDWTKAGNPFVDTQEKFMTYYYSKKTNDYKNNGIPIEVISKKRNKNISEINTFQIFNEVQEYFERGSARAYQLDDERTGYTTFEEDFIDEKDNFASIIGECAYKARSGVEFTPAEVYFIEPEKKSDKKGYYYFKNSQFKNSKYKVASNLPFQIETKYVKPVIKAPEIIPFGFSDNNNYCIFPYEDGNSLAVDEKNLSKNSIDLYKYLTNNKDLIGKQSKRSLTISRGKAFYSLSKVGDYTFSPYKVTFRDNTILSAAVVEKLLTPWGKEVMPICAKHCPYISKDKSGNDITEDEAYYICGILNTEIVKKYFKFTYSTRSYSINFNIKIPKFDIRNKYHKNIMELSREATKNGVDSEILKEINDNYLMLCKAI